MAEGDPVDGATTTGEAETEPEDIEGVRLQGHFFRRTWVRILFLLIEVLAVGGFAYVLGQVTTLTCDRVGTEQIDCTVQTTWLDLLPLGDKSVRGVRGAQVAENCDEDGCTYRVELVTDAGLVPLTSYYSLDSTEKERAAQRVNDFARGTAARSLVVRDHSSRSLLIVLAAFAAGPLVWGLWRRIRAGAD